MVAPHDMPGFFTDWSALDQPRYLRAVYHFTPSCDPRQAAANVCAEQSTAMWQRIGVTEDLRGRFGATVIRLEPLPPGRPHAWALEVAHPHENFGPRLGNLLVALAGEGVFHVPGVAAIRLMDVKFHDEYLQKFDGPQFGVPGVRRQLGVYDRPIFLGVVKPNLGLTPSCFADLVAEAWRGGLDIAKDDEMQADTTWSPVRERVSAVQQRREKSQDGVRWFLANVTDDPDRMLELAPQLMAAGADALLLNPAWTGLGALSALRRISTVPILGHFAGIAAFGKSPQDGVNPVVFITLMRLAGADLIVLPGFGARMGATDAEVLAGIRACLEPLGSLAPALPIPGGSDWAGTLPMVFHNIGHTEFGFIAGRGVFGHPQGPAAGARSLHQAWAAIQACEPLAEAACHAPALAAALRAWS